MVRPTNHNYTLVFLWPQRKISREADFVHNLNKFVGIEMRGRVTLFHYSIKYDEYERVHLGSYKVNLGILR